MNNEDNYAEITDRVNLKDIVDIDYMNEMLKYETNALKETESMDMSIEEENRIISQIKEELLNQAREEMGSELQKYQLSTCRTDSTVPDYSDEMDPVIRKGLYEIKRLDKILLKKIKKEREVKRERILLQKKLAEELNEIEQRNAMLPKEIKNKVEQFLAIKPPPKHNEGMNENTAEDDYPKLFQTEIIQESLQSTNRDIEASQASKSANSSIRRENHSEQTSNSKTSKTTNSRNSKLENQKKKNFIKRNIELASKAAEPVVFTEQEKDRLEYLLADLNDDSSLTAAVDDNYIKSLTSTIDENPFQVATLDQFSDDCQSEIQNESGILSALSIDSDLTSVKHQLSIESRLKHYMGPERYNQLSRIDDRSIFSESILYQVPRDFEDDIDMDNLGEPTLKELKYTREKQERLKEIDSLLEDIQENREDKIIPLDPDVLKDLISSSRGSFSTTNFSEFSDLDSEKDEKYSNVVEMGVEHLSRDLLDSLLREARQSNKKSKLLELISEQTELSEDNTWDPSQSGQGSVSRCESIGSIDRPSSRFPDINLYKHLTSSVPKYK